MIKIRNNPQKAAHEAHVMARVQAVEEEKTEQARVARLPWVVLAAKISQSIVRLPFAILFRHGEYVEQIWLVMRPIRRARRILKSGVTSPRITDARWEKCRPCPMLYETERGSFCGQCGCGETLIGRSPALQVLERWPLLRRIPQYLLRIGRLEYQNMLKGWDCPLGFFRELNDG